MASGGQDSFIAIWRFTKEEKQKSSFEFQVHKYKKYNVIFDSMIYGHENWVNSLHWKNNSKIYTLKSCNYILQFI
jgi:hypothetical protein